MMTCGGNAERKRRGTEVRRRLYWVARALMKRKGSSSSSSSTPGAAAAAAGLTHKIMASVIGWWNDVQ